MGHFYTFDLFSTYSDLIRLSDADGVQRHDVLLHQIGQDTFQVSIYRRLPAVPFLSGKLGLTFTYGGITKDRRALEPKNTKYLVFGILEYCVKYLRLVWARTVVGKILNSKLDGFYRRMCDDNVGHFLTLWVYSIQN